MSLHRLLAAFAMAMVMVISLGSQARAEGEMATSVVIRPIEPVVIGTVVHAVVELRQADGTLIPDEPVALSLDGQAVRRSRTKADGTTSIRLPADLEPGQHELVATYAGRRDRYLASSARIGWEVRAFELQIETVPPLPGMVFSIDGERFAAGEDGIARLAVNRPGQHQLAVHVDEYPSSADRAEFSRWNTELFGPEITYRIPNDKPLQAGFDMYQPASQTFVDVQGEPIDPARISTITMRSSLGIEYENNDGRERWYKASRTVRRPNGLESVEVRYNVDAVVVDGSNVVNAGQQRFYLSGDDQWTIELLLFSARIQTSDALFGFRAGETVDVTFPDGHVLRVEPNADGTIEVRGLARGEYLMKVADSPGWAPAVPVALSRDQEVVLRVVTYIDMAVAFLVAAGLGFGLLHIGRPHLIPGTVRRAGRGAQVIVASPFRLAASVTRPRRRGIWQAAQVAQPTSVAEPARITLSQVVAASIAPPTPGSFEMEPSTGGLGAGDQPQEAPIASRAVPMLVSGIGRRLEAAPELLPPPSRPIPGEAMLRPTPATVTAVPAGLLASGGQATSVRGSTSGKPGSEKPAKHVVVSQPIAGTAGQSDAVVPAATKAETTLAKVRAAGPTRRKTGVETASDTDSPKPPRQPKATGQSTKSGEKPRRKPAAAKTMKTAQAGGRAPKAAKKSGKTVPNGAPTTRTSATKPGKGTRATTVAPAGAPKPVRAGAAAARNPKAAAGPAKAASADMPPPTKPATRRRETRATERVRASGAEAAPARQGSRRGVAKVRAKAAAAKSAITKQAVAPDASATVRARRAAGGDGALASKTAKARRRQPDLLEVVIRRVLRTQAAWATARETDAPALRRSQLAALGLRDPGVGPLRDGPPPLPADAMPTRLDRAKQQQPSKMGHASVTMQDGMLGCAKCGMPLLSGVRFCRRCGWHQIPDGVQGRGRRNSAGRAG